MTAQRMTIGAAVQRCLIVALIVTILVTACTGAWLVFADASEYTFEVLLRAPAVAAVCLTLLLAFTTVILRGRNRAARMLMFAGIVITLAATAMILTLLLTKHDLDNDIEEGLAKFGVTGFAVAVALAYAGALGLVNTPSRLIRGMAIVTGLSAALTAALMIFLLFYAKHVNNDFGFFIMMAITMAILMLLTLTGTVAVPLALISKATKHRPAAESIDARVQVHLGCPACGEKQTLRPGFVKCHACGVGLFIEVEEPRCECGYLLYQLTGDHCPECGRAVVSPLVADPSTAIAD